MYREPFLTVHVPSAMPNVRGALLGGLGWPGLPLPSQIVCFSFKSLLKSWSFWSFRVGDPFRLAGVAWAGLALPSQKACFSFKSLLKSCSFWSFRVGDPFRLAGLGWAGLALPSQKACFSFSSLLKNYAFWSFHVLTIYVNIIFDATPCHYIPISIPFYFILFCSIPLYSIQFYSPIFYLSFSTSLYPSISLSLTAGVGSDQRHQDDWRRNRRSFCSLQ